MSEVDTQTLLEDLRREVEAQKQAVRDVSVANAQLRETLQVVVSRVERLEWTEIQQREERLSEPDLGEVNPKGLQRQELSNPDSNPSHPVPEEPNLKPPSEPAMQTNHREELMLPSEHTPFQWS